MRSTAESPGKQLWAIPAWRYAFPAAVVSRLGDLVFDLTVVLWISADIARGETWAPAAVGGVLIAAAIPVLVVAPIAGVFVDRVDRQRLLIGSAVVQAVVIASLLLIPVLGERIPRAAVLAWIFAAILITNAAAQFFTPARNTMIAKTIPDELRTSAFSRQGSANALLGIAAPAVAAPLYLALGASVALTVNAVSFVAAALLLRAVRWDSAPEPEGRAQSFSESLVNGLRAISRNQLLTAVAFGLTMITFAAGMYNVLEVFFVTDVLHERAEAVGMLLVGFAAGTLVGSLVAPKVERRIGAPTIFVSSFVLVGLCILAYSRTTSLVPAVVLMTLAGAPLGAANAVLMPMVMRAVPSELFGRASSVIFVLPQLASLIAIAITGWLVSTVMHGFDATVAGQHFGAVDTMFALSGLLMILTGALVWRPILRAASRPPAGSVQHDAEDRVEDQVQGRSQDVARERAAAQESVSGGTTQRAAAPGSPVAQPAGASPASQQRAAS